MCESEKRETPRTFAIIPAHHQGWAPERYEASLVRMERQAVTREPFRENVVDPTRVLFPLEDENHVVRIAHEQRTPLEARLHVLHEPLVDNLVQEDVRENG